MVKDHAQYFWATDNWNVISEPCAAEDHLAHRLWIDSSKQRPIQETHYPDIFFFQRTELFLFFLSIYPFSFWRKKPDCICY